MWDAYVDFDLAAFHCHVRMLKFKEHNHAV